MAREKQQHRRLCSVIYAAAASAATARINVYLGVKQRHSGVKRGMAVAAGGKQQHGGRHHDGVK